MMLRLIWTHIMKLMRVMSRQSLLCHKSFMAHNRVVNTRLQYVAMLQWKFLWCYAFNLAWPVIVFNSTGWCGWFINKLCTRDNSTKLAQQSDSTSLLYVYRPLSSWKVFIGTIFWKKHSPSSYSCECCEQGLNWYSLFYGHYNLYFFTG